MFGKVITRLENGGDSTGFEIAASRTSSTISKTTPALTEQLCSVVKRKGATRLLLYCWWGRVWRLEVGFDWSRDLNQSVGSGKARRGKGGGL
jgi:hypothetical protein